MNIPFNKPFIIGKELEYIRNAVVSGKISGDGEFSRKCEAFLQSRYGFRKVLLTTSCTDALEMAAILLDVKPEDEIIVPSFTFVSTANAFVLRGAKIVFADSTATSPNINAAAIEALITPKTKAIVVVHYAGIACDMERILSLAHQYGLFVVEDAAQAIDSFFQERPLGSIGHLSAFSFHETKNIICGEGGALVVNDNRFVNRAEIIREKGTNRSAFFRGEVDKYGWVDIGSSFLPSEISSAFLWAQLENIDKIQAKRMHLWNHYQQNLNQLEHRGFIRLPVIPPYAKHNAHMFFLVCDDLSTRSRLIERLKQCGILAVFHYQSLHKSAFYSDIHDGRPLPNSDHYSDSLLRLPLFYDLRDDQIDMICGMLDSFFTE